MLQIEERRAEAECERDKQVRKGVGNDKKVINGSWKIH